MVVTFNIYLYYCLLWKHPKHKLKVLEARSEKNREFPYWLFSSGRQNKKLWKENYSSTKQKYIWKTITYSSRHFQHLN